MRDTSSTTTVPAPRNETCFMSGAKKSPDLYAKLLPAENTSTMEMMQRKKYTTQMVGSPLNIFEEIAILERRKGKGERGKEKGERRKEKGERRKEKGERRNSHEGHIRN